MTWQKAYLYCQANGKSLLTINSAPKQLDLQTNLPAMIASSNCNYLDDRDFNEAEYLVLLPSFNR